LKKLAVIGDPIAHSLSPVLQNFLIRHFTLPFTYEALRVRVDDLPKMMQRLRDGEFRGVNVTLPHKQAIMPFLEEIDETAARIGAVNTVVAHDGRPIGYNTDAFGFQRSLELAGIALAGKNVLVLGAGGAARAVVYILLQSGAQKIFLCNRHLERVQSLIGAFAAAENHLQSVSWPDRLTWLEKNEIDIIVNTTSVGMPPQMEESPLPKHVFSSKLIVVDLVYNPLQTAFLYAAHAAGAKVVNGLAMLIHQGVAALELWSKQQLDIRDIYANLEKVLISIKPPTTSGQHPV